MKQLPSLQIKALRFLDGLGFVGPMGFYRLQVLGPKQTLPVAETIPGSSSFVKPAQTLKP